jgi:hypothetical protein
MTFDAGYHVQYDLPFHDLVNHILYKQVRVVLRSHQTMAKMYSLCHCTHVLVGQLIRVSV